MQTESGAEGKGVWRWRGWLELLRLPNLFTVPGDAIAGYVLASGGQLRWLPALLMGLAGTCIYGGGLILNDLRDLAEDAVSRPERPLPSGRVDRKHAVWAVPGLFAVGLLLATAGGIRPLLVALVLVGGVVAYDCGLKEVAGVGPLLMGTCRLLNVMLGASASAHGIGLPAALVAASCLGVYIALVTGFARSETRSEGAGGTLWMLPLSLGIGFTLNLGFVWCQPPLLLVGFVLFWVTAMLLSFVPWVMLERPYGASLPQSALQVLGLKAAAPRRPEVLPAGVPYMLDCAPELVLRLKQESIGLLISLLIFLQAALVIGAARSSSAWIMGLLLLAAWLPSRLVAFKFAAS